MKLQDYLEKYGNVSVDETELNEVLGVKPKMWKPRVGENFWWVDNFGEIRINVWRNDPTDLILLSNNKVYRTREEAEFALDKQRFLLQMKRDFEDNSDVIDWENEGQYKFNFRYFHDEDIFHIDYWLVVQSQGSLYTTNRKWLDKYIEDNRDDIKKYVFDL